MTLPVSDMPCPYDGPLATKVIGVGMSLFERASRRALHRAESYESLRSTYHLADLR